MKKPEPSNSYEESDASPAKGTRRPIHDRGIGRFSIRLKQAMQGEALKPFSKRSGISEGSIFSYLSGQTFPSLDRLDAICQATGRTAVWFFADESEQGGADSPAQYQSHPLRGDLLTMAVELIDSELERANKVLPPEKRAVAYGLIYEELLEPGEMPSAKIVQLVIKAVA